jgi:CBS domain-containing protein
LEVNIAYFLIPKSDVAFLYDDCTFRQGLEKMRHHGYTAIPVIARDGHYVGTVSEGDFLWHLLDVLPEGDAAPTLKETEKLRVRDILHGADSYPAVRITVSMEELLSSAMKQNFIPVVDDLGIMTKYIIKRVLLAALTVFLVATITFFLMHTGARRPLRG